MSAFREAHKRAAEELKPLARVAEKHRARLGTLHLYVFAWRDGVVAYEATSREAAEAQAGEYHTGLRLIYCQTITAEAPDEPDRPAFLAYLYTELDEATVLRTSAETGIIRRSDD